MKLSLEAYNWLVKSDKNHKTRPWLVVVASEIVANEED